MMKTKLILLSLIVAISALAMPQYNSTRLKELGVYATLPLLGTFGPNDGFLGDARFAADYAAATQAPAEMAALFAAQHLYIRDPVSAGNAVLMANRVIAETYAERTKRPVHEGYALALVGDLAALKMLPANSVAAKVIGRYTAVAALSRTSEEFLVHHQGWKQNEAVLGVGLAESALATLLLASAGKPKDDLVTRSKVGLSLAGAAGFRVLPVLIDTHLPLVGSLPEGSKEAATLVLGAPLLYLAHTKYALPKVPAELAKVSLLKRGMFTWVTSAAMALMISTTMAVLAHQAKNI